MNIFILDSDHQTNASYYPDKLVVKMPLESLQILVTVLSHHNIDSFIPKKDGSKFNPLPRTYHYHPSVRWTMLSRRNYEYLCKLALELCYEYERRYGKPHGCLKGIQACLGYVSKVSYDSDSTGFSYAINQDYLDAIYKEGTITPKEYKQLLETKFNHSEELIIRLYRAYLRHAKTHYAEWRYSEVPPFWDRQEGCGRLFCKYKPSNTTIKPLPPEGEPTADELSEVDKLWRLNIELSSKANVSKLAKSKIIEAYLTGQDVEKMIFDNVEAKKKAKPQLLRPLEELTLELVENNLDDLRGLVKTFLSKKIPTKKTLTKWQEGLTNSELHKKIKEHISHWSC